MDRRSLFIAFFFIFFLATDISHAAGIIYRVQQMEAMKRQQAQQAQGAEYQQGGQEQGQEQGQQANAQESYQQTVDDRNQAIAQAIIAARSPSVTSGDQSAGNNQVQEQTLSSGIIQQEQVVPQAGPANVEDVVDLSDVWKKLDQKSTVWPLLMDDQAKVLTVSEYIDRFHKEGVKINEPPEHYVQVIDQIVGANPQMLQRPFGELIQIAAIVDYDFDNGMNKDDLARKVLGEAAFEANKKRFSQ